MNILYSPNEPYEIRNDLGDYGIPAPSLPVDYGWFTLSTKSLTERKHMPEDLLASMSDGRLNREVQALLENIEKGGRSYLLLEGKLECDSYSHIISGHKVTGWEIDKVSERLSSIQDVGIKILYSPSLHETALVLISQMRWELKGSHKSIHTRPGPDKDSWGTRPSYSNYILWSYQGCPGISSILAEILYKRASTWEELIKLSVEDIKQLNHFGSKRAERLWKFLHLGKL